MKKIENIKKNPWLKSDVVNYIDGILKKDFKILEVGSGGSSFWFATRTRKVISYEHNRNWYDTLKIKITKQGWKNIELIYDADYPKEGIRRSGDSFDLIIIDGRGRNKAIETTHQLLKPGGYFILDDSDRKRYRPMINFLNKKGWIVISKFSGDEGTIIWRKPKR